MPHTNTSRLVQHPSLLEFAARVNGETVTEQQKAIRALEAERAYLRGIVNDMARTKATLHDGRTLSLYAIYELGLGEPMCCRDAECAGCPDNDPADREVFDAR